MQQQSGQQASLQQRLALAPVAKPLPFHVSSVLSPLRFSLESVDKSLLVKACAHNKEDNQNTKTRRVLEKGSCETTCFV